MLKPASTNANTPGLGIALIILHQNRLLLGKRLKHPMSGSWQLPGGWLRYKESPLQAVSRIVGAFAGMQCSQARFVNYTDNQFDSGLHSVSLYFQMTCLNPQDVCLGDNNDCSDWIWADWYDLPDPLFYPLQLYRKMGNGPFMG